MTPHEHRWLHVAFALSAGAVVVLVGVAIAQDAQRPVTVEQRLIPALGVVDRCEVCHDPATHTGTWTETHPVDKFGCTPCHGGQGLATSASAAHDEAVDWERPLFTPAELQANCGACHTGVRVPDAPKLSKGRQALADRGCAGCHTLPGVPRPDFAPALDGLRDKTTPGWVRAWLQDPGKLDPNHRMPQFRWQDGDIDAVLAYLWTLPGVDLAPLPQGLEGDSDRGKSVLATLRCATCHAYEGRGGTTGPDLSLAGVRLDQRWMWNLLRDTHRVRPQTRMPGFRLTDQDAADVVAYAAEQWVPDTGETPWQAQEAPVRPELASKGQKQFTDLGCGGCHPVGGKLAAPVAVALDRLGDRRVADLPTVRGVHLPEIPSYVARKVLEPRAFEVPGAEPARMPTFPRVTPDEAEALGIALASMRASTRPAAWLKDHQPPPPPLPNGETGEIVERYRCLVCHRMGVHGGDVSKAPLDGVAARLRRPWLERFLREPLTVRMDQAERMPVLGMTAHEAELLTGWLKAMFGDHRVQTMPPIQPGDVERGKALYAQHKCADCHVGGGGGTMKGPTLDGAAWRLEPAYVYALLAQGRVVVPELRHPEAVLAPEDARALAAYVLSLPAPWPWEGGQSAELPWVATPTVAPPQPSSEPPANTQVP